MYMSIYLHVLKFEGRVFSGDILVDTRQTSNY
jgi:hypothetical protein